MNELNTMVNPELRDLLDRKLDLRRRQLIDPDIAFPSRLKPCLVQVLLVADGFLYFSDEDFGLSDFIETLATTAPPWVKFDITCAHRASPGNTRLGVGNPNVTRTIANFRFDDPSHFGDGMYDQVWLFGARTDSFDPATGTSPGKPADTELKAIATFMDAGGGVFATGDHGALGAALCGHIPRVRSMRAWFAGAAPFGAPSSTSMTDGNRHDTNRPGHDGIFSFDDQSDDIPQEILPRMYVRRVGFFTYSFPHPLLCGPEGIIKVMPDHPHEGECTAPHETGRVFRFGGTDFREYPDGAAGVPVLPEIIAISHVLPDNSHPGKSGTHAKCFGSICAYDGEQAAVGRVVTDATWHHFININLTGAAGLPTSNPKSVGFLTPAGAPHYRKIQAYFRNIATWISPKARRNCMALRAIWWAIWQERLLEAVTDGRPQSLGRMDIMELVSIGAFARDVLGRFAGRCQVRGWIIDPIRPVLPTFVLKELDPWLPRPELPEPPVPPDPAPWMDAEPLLDAVLGAQIVALRERFPDDPGRAEKGLEEEIQAICGKAASHALNLYVEAAETATEGMNKFTLRFRESLR